MALQVETFASNATRTWRPGNNFGGTSLFKALSHPLIAPRARAFVEALAAAGPIAVYDPLNQAGTFDALYGLPRGQITDVFVQQVVEAGQARLGRPAQVVTRLPETTARSLLVACFDAGRQIAQLQHLLPQGTVVRSFDDLRLPDNMLSDPASYLAPVNFATNFALFRDRPGDHTRLVSANYWGGYGATDPQLWLCLFDTEGRELAAWFEPLPVRNGSFAIDSAEVARRFGLGAFTGSLFIHAVRIKGHDVVKYALDTYGDDRTSLSCTHDSNPWPADLYGGLPAPRAGERVDLWIQNAYPLAIPAGGIGINTMGSQHIAWLDEDIPPFATRAVDVARLLPDAVWPQQIEIQAGRYCVRPRYEITAASGRRHIAHANVERTDLVPDPAIPGLAAVMGKGYILPLPVLPVDRFDTLVLPTPMTTAQRELPLSLVLYDASGVEVARRWLGRLPRTASVPTAIADWLRSEGAQLPSGYGHVELMYDFRDGGEADGWLHAIGRYRQHGSGHEADTSFGAHIYNTPIVYKDEPQSYVAAPPGLSTRLFLRVGPEPLDTLCHLVYPASTPWHARSSTSLTLFDGAGREVARRDVAIACSGSLFWTVNSLFTPDERRAAGANAAVQIRDVTCRLFGFHGLQQGADSFCIDHMFGF